MRPQEEKTLLDASVLSLSFVGDAVHTLFVRERVFADSPYRNDELHKLAAAKCCATAQAEAAKRLESLLTEEERFVFKKGKNARVGSVPKNATLYDYKLATALEAVIGYLHLAGRTARLREILMALYPTE